MSLVRAAAASIWLLLASCALTPPGPPRPAVEPEAVRCLETYSSLDRAVSETGATPSSPARVEGFPYLRVNRFLAAYRNQSLEGPALNAWLARLAELDLEARQIELDALPAAVLSEATTMPRNALNLYLASCSQRLQAHDLKNRERLEMIKARAVVPDDYHTLSQVLGLYPLTALPISYGVFRWQEETRRLFGVPLEALPVQGELRRLQPPQAAPAAPRFTTPARDALDIPLIEPAQLAELFAAHAPVWEIDTAGEFDRPGAPRWRAEAVPGVDPDEPAVYGYPSYVHWRGRGLLQLNYLIWFAERPRSGSLDILGGALDGLIWRATLDEHGAALLYDSIHPCGCYQQFFPSSALRLKPQALLEFEPPLIPQWAPSPGRDERIVIRIGSGNHYIQRVYTDRPSGRAYIWRDYRTLYAIPAGDGKSRSLFGPDGLVPGSERGERWLLWPMGVPSPGAMRERGRQATAFVGRRHFDEPGLLERLFEPGSVKP